MSNMTIQKWASAVLALSLSAAVITGCSSANVKPNATEAPQPSPTEAAAEESESPAEADPFGKYDSPVQLKMARLVDTTFKFKPGESIDNNDWNKLFLDRLGIDLKYAWTANQQQYPQKMNVTIASGDIPDLMQVWGPQVSQLADADSLADLTEAYEKYASPRLKELMNLDGGIALNTAKRDGKLYAIPEPASTVPNTMLFIRKDWLDKLGLDEPKTLQDVFAISEAFATQDPDGNGKKDTYGIGLQKDFSKNKVPFGIEGLASGFHAYLDTWIQDGKGGLTQSTILPEMRDVLLQLQEMYKGGQIDKEFGVKDSSKVNQDVVAGRIGMFYGPQWSPALPLKDSWANDKADWRSYGVVSIDDKPALLPVKPNGQNYFVVKKGYPNPEAAIKLANLFADISLNVTEENFNKYMKSSIDDGNGGKSVIEVFKYAPIRLQNHEAVFENMKLINDAVKSGDPSQLGVGDNLASYERLKKWETDKTDPNAWQDWALLGEGGTYSVQEMYVRENRKINDEYWGPTTETMSKKQSTLDKKKEEVFTSIVLGAPIEEFDKFVSDWKALGGDEISKEVNDWYATIKQ
ncbi:extracellular solute-binding protein [Paenibacillus sp. IB182496]|uniref:Extracellular solute-binding protein n=1 Tax=Paenibacillus sabuli TaxID=2772509 RepID=A0A927BRC0_9BACL|nr:extracellular solute-binding protein [Paenibacillus sabuli]MBD2844058.1 extracellular solute-binding protein [Paenibacillus sabuli]